MQGRKCVRAAEETKNSDLKAEDGITKTACCNSVRCYHQKQGSGQKMGKHRGLPNIITSRGHGAERRLAIAVLKIMKYTAEECEVT